MTDLTVTFKNQLDRKNIGSYDIAAFDISIVISSDEKFLVEGITFMIAVQEVNASDYEDESGFQVYEDYLMIPENDDSGQQTNINDQIGQLPFEISGDKALNLSIDLVSSKSKTRNFLDILKDAPDNILDNEKELELFIKCIVNPDKNDEFSHYEIYRIANPFI